MAYEIDNPDCDRCHKKIEGGISHGCSAGCYVVNDGPWEKFSNADEAIICDACMWTDPRYIAVYGAPGCPPPLNVA